MAYKKKMLGEWIFGLPFAIFNMILRTVATVVTYSNNNSFMDYKLLTSYFIQNPTFAEVFMTCHSITEANQG